MTRGSWTWQGGGLPREDLPEQGEGHGGEVAAAGGGHDGRVDPACDQGRLRGLRGQGAQQVDCGVARPDSDRGQPGLLDYGLRGTHRGRHAPRVPGAV